MSKQLIKVANDYLSLYEKAPIPSDWTVNELSTGVYNFSSPDGQYDITLYIEDKGDHYTVGIVPDYSVKVIASDDWTAFRDDDIQNFEAAVDEVYDYIGNNTPVPQWTTQVHKRNEDPPSVIEIVEGWFENELTATLLTNWYIDNYIMAPFMDQTRAHRRAQIREYGLYPPERKAIVQTLVDMISEEGKTIEGVYAEVMNEAITH
jgi:hypothetical protein